MAKRTVLNRANWIAIFEAAATRRGDELNDEWYWLLDQLGMTAEDYPALVEALRQGRWRDSKNPRAYVKTVARREALRETIKAERNDILKIIPSRSGDQEFSVEKLLDHLSYIQETAEAVQGPDGIWRPGGSGERGYYDYYDEDENGQPVSLRGRLRAKLPESLLKALPTSQSVEDIDWQFVPIRVDLKEWVKLAGFDLWETQVMHYHLNGISRDKALAEQPDSVARKAIQAAWRRYDRTGKQRLRQVAEKMLQKNVPKPSTAHTS